MILKYKFIFTFFLVYVNLPHVPHLVLPSVPTRPPPPALPHLRLALRYRTLLTIVPRPDIDREYCDLHCRLFVDYVWGIGGTLVVHWWGVNGALVDIRGTLVGHWWSVV